MSGGWWDPARAIGDGNASSAAARARARVPRLSPPARRDSGDDDAPPPASPSSPSKTTTASADSTTTQGEEVSVADKRALRLKEAMLAWITSAQEYARARKIFAKLGKGGITEAQVKVVKRTARIRMHELQICILVEATKEERSRMGRRALELPHPGVSIRWAIQEGGSPVLEQAVRWSFSEATTLLDSLVVLDLLINPCFP